MGARADFYVGRGEKAEWLGSIAWDGNPSGIPIKLRKSETESIFRDLVASFLVTRDDKTLPADGWPWLWEDSRTTDYAYAFDGGKVLVSCFGHEWFDSWKKGPEDDEGGKMAIFPNMKAIQKVSFGRNSGFLIFRRLAPCLLGRDWL